MVKNLSGSKKVMEKFLEAAQEEKIVQEINVTELLVWPNWFAQSVETLLWFDQEATWFTSVWFLSSCTDCHIESCFPPQDGDIRALLDPFKIVTQNLFLLGRCGKSFLFFKAVLNLVNHVEIRR